MVAQIYGEIQHTSGAKFTEKSKEYQNTVEAQKLQKKLPNYQRSQITEKSKGYKLLWKLKFTKKSSITKLPVELKLTKKSKKYQITVEAQKFTKRSRVTKLPEELKLQRYPVGSNYNYLRSSKLRRNPLGPVNQLLRNSELVNEN